MGKHHLDLYLALKEFQKEQSAMEIAIAEASLEENIKGAPCNKWIELQCRLCTVTTVYHSHRALILICR